LIVCEGESERAYFGWVKQQIGDRRLVLRVELGKSSDPRAVVRTALNLSSADPKHGLDQQFDEVWAVFDWDGHTDRVREAMEMMRQADEERRDPSIPTCFRCALSNPCFELWYLWHVCDYMKPGCTKEQVQRAWKTQCPEYAKSAVPVGMLDVGGYEQAVRRAASARRSHDGVRAYPEDRPSTGVDELMESLAVQYRGFRGLDANAPLPF
jgi:hypothetical protein